MDNVTYAWLTGADTPRTLPTKGKDMNTTSERKARLSVLVTLWREGEKLATIELAERHVIETREDADLATLSFLRARMDEGASVTFSAPNDEYRVSMPDGSAYYVRTPAIAYVEV